VAVAARQCQHFRGIGQQLRSLGLEAGFVGFAAAHAAGQVGQLGQIVFQLQLQGLFGPQGIPGQIAFLLLGFARIQCPQHHAHGEEEQHDGGVGKQLIPATAFA
jgi:hypothetical protein